MTKHTHHDDQLQRDLRALFDQKIETPRQVDDAVLNQARATLAGVRTRTAADRRPMRLVRTHAGRIAIAAALLIVAAVALRFVALPGSAPPAMDEANVAQMTGDINGDGRVDIVDAFMLARQVRDADLSQREAWRNEWDVNGDAVIDDDDVDAIARMAVALSSDATNMGHGS